MTIDLAGYFARYKGRPHEKAAVQLLSERMPASLLKPDAEWVELFDAATPDKPVALPLQLVHDTGEVGLVWREPTPDPALAVVLQALVDACASMALATAPKARVGER